MHAETSLTKFKLREALCPVSAVECLPKSRMMIAREQNITTTLALASSLPAWRRRVFGSTSFVDWWRTGWRGSCREDLAMSRSHRPFLSRGVTVQLIHLSWLGLTDIPSQLPNFGSSVPKLRVWPQVDVCGRYIGLPPTGFVNLSFRDGSDLDESLGDFKVYELLRPSRCQRGRTLSHDCPTGDGWEIDSVTPFLCWHCSEFAHKVCWTPKTWAIYPQHVMKQSDLIVIVVAIPCWTLGFATNLSPTRSPAHSHIERERERDRKREVRMSAYLWNAANIVDFNPIRQGGISTSTKASEQGRERNLVGNLFFGFLNTLTTTWKRLLKES